jgi:hypothetical protein
VAEGERERKDGGRRRRGDKEGEKENEEKNIYILMWNAISGCGELVVSVATLLF